MAINTSAFADLLGPGLAKVFSSQSWTLQPGYDHVDAEGVSWKWEPGWFKVYCAELRARGWRRRLPENPNDGLPF